MWELLYREMEGNMFIGEHSSWKKINESIGFELSNSITLFIYIDQYIREIPHTDTSLRTECNSSVLLLPARIN